MTPSKGESAIMVSARAGGVPPAGSDSLCPCEMSSLVLALPPLDAGMAAECILCLFVCLSEAERRVNIVCLFVCWLVPVTA